MKAGLEYWSAPPLPASLAERGQGEGRYVSELCRKAAPHRALCATFSPKKDRGEVKSRLLLILTITLALLASAAAARAACPQELAIYEDANGASITFLPPHANMAAEHEFIVRMGQTELQGIVMWSKDPDRPNGIVMDQCPDGDVTGEELDKCTVWQGVIYGLTKDATAPFLGKRGTPNFEAILLPDFSRYAMDHTYKTPLAGPVKVDDVFKMKGCQE